MSFYEQTIVTKQDLSAPEVEKVESKYADIISGASGKVVKIEKWGLLNFARKIKNYNRGHYIHIKFEGNGKTLEEINKKIKIDNSILRNLIIKYKKLNLEMEYFNKEKTEDEKAK
jgi:small subunit ribosomal protein S6|tara:strand:- start:1061 stop:1405 length:345 start_codon:yes stop_codon:yes gene_type:complete